MSELKPCPFCGTSNCEIVSNGHDSQFVECMFCGASGPAHENHDETTEAWNRRAQPAQAVHLHQALTDPENQPNQYGVEFFMHGPKFAFKVGTQQFTLDYEPTEPGEFEFMQAALIYAFSVFTPDVKTAQAVPVLAESELRSILQGTNHMVKNAMHGAFWPELEEACRAIEQAVRAKMGAAVPMTHMQIVTLWGHRSDGPSTPEIVSFARLVERHHGIVGKEGA
mgnify:CR=1 FL=1